MMLLLLVHGVLIQFSKTGLGLFIHFLDLISQSTVIPIHHHGNRHGSQCGHRNHTTKLGGIHSVVVRIANHLASTTRNFSTPVQRALRRSRLFGQSVEFEVFREVDDD